ncbi:MFS transporter [Deinococcus multiflagellatus]|uniref:MFS transporter n=1 Tax=Deinococcus multiflagellatus TaxID=1656887 RepID=A0ABW1ZFR7_9DEIO
MRGRLDDARAALAVVARVNRRPLPEAPLSPPSPGAVAARHRHLLGPAWRDRTFLLAGAWFGMSLGYYGIFSWLPAYLRTQGVDLGETYRTAMILAIAQIPGYLLASLLIEWAGRRVTLVAFMLASAAGAYLFLVAGDSSVAALLTSALLSCSLLGAGGAVRLHARTLSHPAARRGHGPDQRVWAAGQRALAPGSRGAAQRQPGAGAKRVCRRLHHLGRVRVGHWHRDAWPPPARRRAALNAARTLAVYIGRFQPPHAAHLHTMRAALAGHGQLLVLLGSANLARSVKNPWSAAERARLIRRALAAQGCP